MSLFSLAKPLTRLVRLAEGPSGNCRFMSSNCGKNCGDPPCGGDMPKNSPCAKEAKTFKSMWAHPKFCPNSKCPDLMPRFDQLYYKMSDYTARTYAQTWATCIPKAIPKKVCCIDRIRKAPFYKRKPKPRPKTKCPKLSKESERLLSCMKIPEDPCPRTKYPCCRGSRVPPHCHNFPGPSNCKKSEAPYPSYSECMKLKAKEKPGTECGCAAAVSLCEMYRERRKREEYGTLSDFFKRKK